MTTETTGYVDDEKPAVKDDDVVAEAKQYLKFCIAMEGDNHREGLDDLRFLSGEQWSEADKRSRSMPGMERPCLTINKLPTFLHQVTNDLRQNVPSIKVSPVNDGADIKTSEVLQGIIRHIEYASNADVAYDTAVMSAAAIGFGYFMLETDYCDPKSFDQDIRFKRIRNPFTVYFDPMSEEPDGSDAKRCMITSKMSKVDFHRDYPDAEYTYDGFDTGAGDPSSEGWVEEEAIRVAAYYRIVEKADTLVELSNGEVGLKSKLIEMPPGVSIKRSRATSTPTIEWFKLTCYEILERTEIKCKWIPVFPVYGDEIDMDGKVRRYGLIRNAKDPQKMYNYTMTSATEEVATRNKTPYIGAEGQFEGYEEDWAQANTSNFPYLEYKPVSFDGTQAPPPQKQPMTDIPNGMLTLAMHANDNIKATTGLFDSSLGAKGNATSGKQEVAQQRQGDLANFHYADNLTRSIRQAARCLISMIPNYLDTRRVMKIMGEDGKLSHATINDPSTEAVPMSQAPPGSPPMMGPNGQPQQDPQTGETMAAVQTVLHDMSIDEYDSVVSSGPSYNTLRQEAADNMVNLAGKWPKLMEVAGDVVVSALDWPMAQRIAGRIKASIPPQILQADPDDKGKEQPPMVMTPKGPIPLDQASQMLQEMDQQMTQMGQLITNLKAGVVKTQVKADSDERIAAMAHGVKQQDNQQWHQTELAKTGAKLQTDVQQQQADQAHERALKQMDISADAHAQAAKDNTTIDVAELNGLIQLLLNERKGEQQAEMQELQADTQKAIASNGASKPNAPATTKKTLADDVKKG